VGGGRMCRIRALEAGFGAADEGWVIGDRF